MRPSQMTDVAHRRRDHSSQTSRSQIIDVEIRRRDHSSQISISDVEITITDVEVRRGEILTDCSRCAKVITCSQLCDACMPSMPSMPRMPSMPSMHIDCCMARHPTCLPSDAMRAAL